ncbi:unnamed protein product, partial [Prorocentrum cordatum]
EIPETLGGRRIEPGDVERHSRPLAGRRQAAQLPRPEDPKCEPVVQGDAPSNDDGAPVFLGTRKHYTDTYYCGRRLGPDLLQGYSASGVCGPRGGPQCLSCRRFQALARPDRRHHAESLHDDSYKRAVRRAQAKAQLVASALEQQLHEAPSTVRDGRQGDPEVFKRLHGDHSKRKEKLQDARYLVAKDSLEVWATTTSRKVLRIVVRGDVVQAKGSPEQVEGGFTMQPIEPEGAVDARCLQPVRGDPRQLRFIVGEKLVMLGPNNEKKACTIVKVAADKVMVSYGGIDNVNHEWVQKDSENLRPAKAGTDKQPFKPTLVADQAVLGAVRSGHGKAAWERLYDMGPKLEEKRTEAIRRCEEEEREALAQGSIHRHRRPTAGAHGVFDRLHHNYVWLGQEGADAAGENPEWSARPSSAFRDLEPEWKAPTALALAPSDAASSAGSDASGDLRDAKRRMRSARLSFLEGGLDPDGAAPSAASGGSRQQQPRAAAARSGASPGRGASGLASTASMGALSAAAATAPPMSRQPSAASLRASPAQLARPSSTGPSPARSPARGSRGSPEHCGRRLATAGWRRPQPRPRAAGVLGRQRQPQDETGRLAGLAGSYSEEPEAERSPAVRRPAPAAARPVRVGTRGQTPPARRQ